MSKEVINLSPRLKEGEFNEFLEYSKNLGEKLNNTSLERENILQEAKKEITRLYKGNNLNSNIEVAFIKSLLIDLLLQDWDLKIEGNSIQLELRAANDKSLNLSDEKQKIRRRHLIARNTQLKEANVEVFIKSIERRKLTPNGWKSIFSLMRDGCELEKSISTALENSNQEHREKELDKLIQPYIQFVEPNVRCTETGLLLSEIWRYFRHTWINEYKSLPGRSISILIRDAAAPNHPVIGIAALGSSVAQQSCRDRWIGWDGESFIKKLAKEPSAKHAKWIIKTLNNLFNDVYLKDFFQEKIITLSDITTPTESKIKELRELSIHYKKEHLDNPHKAKFTSENNELTWEQRAQQYLFKSKRALLLSDILSIKLTLIKSGFEKGTLKELERCLCEPEFRSTIEKLVRKAKSVQVGINMMDIIVCGSIAPYNHLLGGKLVCMLLTSPEVSDYYNNKYSDSISLIASSMKGEAVVRKPQLVFLGTTSLYGVGSSQYNRIKMYTDELGSKKKNVVEYKNLGYSEGFGSFHFSSLTLSLAEALNGRNTGKKRVNSIFGEGANPLLRKVKDALEFLELESNPILNHRNRRVVYGIALAENFGNVLIGLDDKPKYLIPHSNLSDKTKKVSDYWKKRWFFKRVLREDILEDLKQHTLSYPIKHGAKVPLEEKEEVLTLF